MAAPKPAPARPPRAEPSKARATRRNRQPVVPQRWHERLDRVSAYGPAGLGLGSMVGTALLSHNLWMTLGAGTVGKAFEVFTAWWGRYKTKREKSK